MTKDPNLQARDLNDQLYNIKMLLLNHHYIMDKTIIAAARDIIEEAEQTKPATKASKRKEALAKNLIKEFQEQTEEHLTFENAQLNVIGYEHLTLGAAPLELEDRLEHASFLCFDRAEGLFKLLKAIDAPRANALLADATLRTYVSFGFADDRDMMARLAAWAEAHPYVPGKLLQRIEDGKEGF
ncbi:hypothetical protein ACN47E_008133 [Coniothyrium glycines]